jgi:hypothetical protein
MKYLRTCLVGTCPETVKAFEYQSDIYLSQARVPVLPSVSWESDALETEKLIEVLRNRGWHTTDIGDALNEPRRAHRREA